MRPTPASIRLMTVVVIALAVSACAGSASPQASASPEAPIAPTPTSDGPSRLPAEPGGASGGACALATADEVEGVLDTIDELAGLEIPLDERSSICSYGPTSGSPVASISLLTSGAANAFGAFKASPGAVLVAGLGDEAVWDPTSASLVILRGERASGISAGDASMSLDARFQLAKALGAIVADRL